MVNVEYTFDKVTTTKVTVDMADHEYNILGLRSAFNEIMFKNKNMRNVSIIRVTASPDSEEDLDFDDEVNEDMIYYIFLKKGTNKVLQL
ncbi:hypothetical protein IWW39_006226 [Coemansia spiralis]|uniref:Uncharacterized protein n=1 Tax=Coemansia spiralis TaxID=417178 RepID=A0A9W8GG13_9FUNG|nr:hypothetical protein IWW39_006226 [Coemansia spiralis]